MDRWYLLALEPQQIALGKIEATDGCARLQVIKHSFGEYTSQGRLVRS
jgi:hypothetical protein